MSELEANDMKRSSQENNSSVAEALKDDEVKILRK